MYQFAQVFIPTHFEVTPFVINNNLEFDMINISSKAVQNDNILSERLLLIHFGEIVTSTDQYEHLEIAQVLRILEVE